MELERLSVFDLQTLPAGYFNLQGYTAERTGAPDGLFSCLWVNFNPVRGDCIQVDGLFSLCPLPLVVLEYKLDFPAIEDGITLKYRSHNNDSPYW